MVRIAVTGGIACGKSRMALYMESCGISVCEADELAHTALSPDTKVYAGIIDAFGEGILDEAGQIDRRKLGEVVFEDRGKLARLNALVHPYVKEKISNWIADQERLGQKMAVVIIPLLFEAGMESGWDAVICVGCHPDVQQKRLIGRGLSIEECRQRIAAQMPQSDKIKNSDFVIWNDGSESLFEQKIDDVLEMIQEKVV